MVIVYACVCVSGWAGEKKMWFVFFGNRDNKFNSSPITFINFHHWKFISQISDLCVPWIHLNGSPKLKPLFLPPPSSSLPPLLALSWRYHQREHAKDQTEHVCAEKDEQWPERSQRKRREEGGREERERERKVTWSNHPKWPIRT